MRNRFIGGNKGFSLIEVLVGMAILSIVAAGVLALMFTSTNAVMQARVRTTATNVAKTEMEYVKALYYFPAASGGFATYVPSAPPANYTVSTLDRSNTKVDGSIYGIPWDVTTNAPYTPSGSSPIDPGIQKITVIVNYNGNVVFTLVDFILSGS